jgi:putative hydrolase
MRVEIDTHTHTLASGHAYNTMNEMAKAAADKGLKGLAITEHAPEMPGTCHLYYFQNLRIVPRKRFGIELLLGTELNIMNAEGKVDLSEDVLKTLDIAIASIHIPCFRDERTVENVTAAYENVMENPYVDIIGHPDDGRYPVDYEQLAKKAKETGTVLEVNNGSLRPGGFRVDTRKNDLKMLEYCKKYEVPVTMGSDAHMDVDLADYSYALPVIEESHFPEELIVNSSAELLKSCIRYKRNMWKQKKVNC